MKIILVNPLLFSDSQSVSDSEYDDYTPQFPELIPSGEAVAQTRLNTLSGVIPVVDADTKTFLEGWWALAWLFPGLHPDDAEDWDGEFSIYRPLADEAFARAERGEISDSQLYPTEAAHNRIWVERIAIGSAS